MSSTQTTHPSVPIDARRVLAIVAVASLAVFMSSLDLFIVNLAFPSIGREYAGTPLSTLSWVLNAYTIVFAAVLVPAGRWADRIGRRRIFVAGLSTFAVGSLLCGLSPGVGALIAARVVQSAGAGLMVPASLSLLLASVPGERRASAIGTWSAFGALGAALGPVIGGSLVQIDWPWVFWINLPVAVLAVALAARVIPESRDERTTRRPDLLGAAVLAVSVGLLALALVKGPDWGWSSAGFVGLLIATVLGGAAVVARSRRHPAPVIDLALLRLRSFSGAFGASVLYYGAFGAWLLALVEFLTGVWHYSPVRAGLAIAPGPLMVLPFARVVAPRLAARLGGPGRVAMIGALVNLASQAFWYARIEAHPAYLSALLPAQLLGGAGVGLTIPSLLGAGTALLPSARFGTGSGVLNMSRQIGTVIGVAALIAVLAHTVPGDPVAPFRHAALLVGSFFGATFLMAAATLSPRTTPARAGSPTLVAPALDTRPRARRMTRLATRAPITFSQRVDRPFPHSLAALAAWQPTGRRWLAIRSTTVDAIDDRPTEYRLSVRIAGIARSVPVEVRVTPWSARAGSHIELLPSRPVRPGRRYLTRCRTLLGELTDALTAEVSPHPPMIESPVPASL